MVNVQDCFKNRDSWQGFPYYGAMGVGAPPISWFFRILLIKVDALPPSFAPLKIEPLQLINKAPSKKWFLEKKPKKSETVINTCVSLIKQHWKKIAEIPQKQDFLTWSIQNFD